MTIQVQLTVEEEIALQKKARAVGQDLVSYAASMLKRDAHRPIRSIEEIAADIEKRRGGPLDLTEDEIADVLEQAKHERRAERRRPGTR